MRRRVLATLLGISVVLAGWFLFRSLKPNRAANPIVRVGYLRLLSADPFYTALREGYFTDEGLQVEPRVINSGPEGNEGLAANNIDVAFSIVPSLLISRFRGVPADLVSIYGASLDSPTIHDHRVIVAATSPIETVTALKGKKIAVVGWPGMTSDVLELLDYLGRHGLELDSVTLVGMAHADMIAAVLSGTVDAAASAEPYVSMAVASGKLRTLKEGDGYYYGPTQTEVTTYLARRSWIDAHQDLARRFVAALDRGRQKASDRSWLCGKGIPVFNKQHNPPIDFPVISADLCLDMSIPPVNRSLTSDGLTHVTEQLIKRKVISHPVCDVEVCTANLMGDATAGRGQSK